MLPDHTLLREVLYVMGPGTKHRVWIYNDAKNTVCLVASGAVGKVAGYNRRRTSRREESMQERN